MGPSPGGPWVEKTSLQKSHLALFREPLCLLCRVGTPLASEPGYDIVTLRRTTSLKCIYFISPQSCQASWPLLYTPAHLFANTWVNPSRRSTPYLALPELRAQELIFLSLTTLPVTLAQGRQARIQD